MPHHGMFIVETRKDAYDTYFFWETPPSRALVLFLSGRPRGNDEQ